LETREAGDESTCAIEGVKEKDDLNASWQNTI